ncbi:MAG: tetratricopeptide repeat protein, partial [Bacteroidota bacterium]|nr:tetratricopeptide repeat protein [Bacteroidota bacterium]
MQNHFVKTIFLIYAFFCLGGGAKANQTENDTIDINNEDVQDTSKIQILNKIAERNLETYPGKAFEKASEALTLATLSNNQPAKATSLRNMGLSHMYLFFDYEKALEYCFEALKIEEGMVLKAGEATTLMTIGSIYEEVGNNNTAVEYYRKSLKIQKALENYFTISKLNHKIGNAFSKLQQYDSALLYHRKALDYEIENDNKKGEADSYNAIANVFSALNNTADAYHFHTKALALRREINDKPGEARSLNYIAEIYKKTGNYIRAHKNLDVALAIWKQLNKQIALADTYNSIGEVYLLQKKYQQAQEHLEMGLNYALETNDKKSIRFSYEKLYTCHLAQKNYEEALENKNYFLAIDEFIISEENEKKISELQSLYELNKKESEIMALKINQQIKEMELRDQETFHTFLIVVIGFVVVIVMLVLYLYRIKQRSNKQLTLTNEKINKNNEALQAANATKDKFFSIIAHDLKGPLSSLTSFSNLLINHTASLSQEEIQMVAKDLDKSVGNLFSLLENLLEWSRSQTGIIEYNPEAISLSGVVNNTLQLLEVSAQNKNITLESSISEQTIVQVDRNSITTVIRNLISNAIKFTNKGGKVAVFAEEENDNIVIFVKDNGVGMNQEVQE